MKHPKITGKYILNAAGEPVLEPDFWTWACWYETHDQEREVAFDKVGDDFEVSTVFLALDQSLNNFSLRMSSPLESRIAKACLASSGYLELGMFDDAVMALEEIAPEDKNRNARVAHL